MAAKQIDRLLNGNRTTMWRSLVVILFGIFTAFCGWMFNEVYGFNTQFVGKHDYEKDIVRLEKKMELGMSDIKTEVRDLRKIIINGQFLQTWPQRHDHDDVSK